jgi:hypothetical protein
MTRRAYQILERVFIAIIVLGIAAMFQPWELELYHYGFVVLFFATLGFIILIHWPVRADED